MPGEEIIGVIGRNPATVVIGGFVVGIAGAAVGAAVGDRINTCIRKAHPPVDTPYKRILGIKSRWDTVRTIENINEAIPTIKKASQSFLAAYKPFIERGKDFREAGYSAGKAWILAAKPQEVTNQDRRQAEKIEGWVWDPIRAAIERASCVPIDLPGFGTVLTSDDYHPSVSPAMEERSMVAFIAENVVDVMRWGTMAWKSGKNPFACALKLYELGAVTICVEGGKELLLGFPIIKGKKRVLASLRPQDTEVLYYSPWSDPSQLIPLAA